MVDLTQSYLPIDPDTFPKNLYYTVAEDAPDKGLPILPYDGFNFLPTYYGYKSYFGHGIFLGVSALSLPSGERIQEVITFQLGDYRTLLLVFTTNKMYYNLASEGGSSWKEVTSTETQFPWTYAYLGSSLYFYKGGANPIHSINSTALTYTSAASWSVAFGTHTPVVGTTSILTADMYGIFRANGRIGMWNTSNGVFWGGFFERFNFTPDTSTQAGQATFKSVKGNILHIEEQGDGFLIFSTRNIVGVRPTGDASVLWDSSTVSDSAGIIWRYNVCRGREVGDFLVYSTSGFIQIGSYNGLEKKYAITSIFPELYDFIKEQRAPVRLALINGRYLFISSADRALLDGNAYRDFNGAYDFVGGSPGGEVVATTKIKWNTVCDRATNLSDQQGEWTSTAAMVDTAGNINTGLFAAYPFSFPEFYEENLTGHPRKPLPTHVDVFNGTSYIRKTLADYFQDQIDFSAVSGGITCYKVRLTQLVNHPSAPVQSLQFDANGNATYTSPVAATIGDTLFSLTPITLANAERNVRMQQYKTAYNITSRTFTVYLAGSDPRTTLPPLIETLKACQEAEFALRNALEIYLAGDNSVIGRYAAYGTRIYHSSGIFSFDLNTGSTEGEWQEVMQGMPFAYSGYPYKVPGAIDTDVTGWSLQEPETYSISDWQLDEMMMPGMSSPSGISYYYLHNGAYTTSFNDATPEVPLYASGRNVGENATTIALNSASSPSSYVMYDTRYPVNNMEVVGNAFRVTGSEGGSAYYWHYVDNLQEFINPWYHLPAYAEPAVAPAFVFDYYRYEWEVVPENTVDNGAEWDLYTGAGIGTSVGWEDTSYEVTYPETGFFLLGENTIPKQPALRGGFLYDFDLKKFGKYLCDHYAIMDYKSFNNSSALIETSNFGVDAGYVKLDGSMTLFTERPTVSQLTYGKIGYERKGVTQAQEVRVEFRDTPNCTVSFKSYIDGALYTTTEVTTADELVMYLSTIGRFHTITFSGTFDLTYLEFRGNTAGRR
jgi:hypothetical protein